MKEARGVAILYSVTTLLAMDVMTTDVMVVDVVTMAVVAMDVRDTL